MVIALVDLAIIICAGYLLFGVPIKGSIVQLALFALFLFRRNAGKRPQQVATWSVGEEAARGTEEARRRTALVNQDSSHGVVGECRASGMFGIGPTRVITKRRGPRHEGAIARVC